MSEKFTAAAIFAGVCASIALAGTVAAPANAAPDSSGKTYAEAKERLERAGYTVVVAATVGDKLPWADCQVYRQQMKPSPLAGKKNEIDRTRVLLSLRCYPSTSEDEGE